MEGVSDFLIPDADSSKVSHLRSLHPRFEFTSKGSSFRAIS